MWDLVRRWEKGWERARSLAPAEPIDGGLRIVCLQPSRDIEILALDDSPSSLTKLARRLGTETTSAWLTVPTTRPQPTSTTLANAGLTFHSRSEALMAIDLNPDSPAAQPGGYELAVNHDGDTITATVTRGAEVAASGVAGLHGTDAILDKITTEPEHRRRGLGRTVMSALTTAALERGATAGILIASLDGQALYTPLGWAAHADVLITKYVDSAGA